MKNWLKKWMDLFLSSARDDTGQDQAGKGKLSFLQWILILIMLGMAAMILNSYFQDDEQASMTRQNEEQLPVDVEVEDEETFGKARGSPSSMQEYEEYLENQLKDILSKVQGVGDASVMINLDSTEEVVYEKNRQTQQSHTDEEDREGGKRQVEDQSRDEQVVVLRQGNDEQAVVVKTKKPAVRGVLVVAPGAEHMQVKAWVAEAVQRVLDVPAHRVSVLPKNG